MDPRLRILFIGEDDSDRQLIVDSVKRLGHEVLGTEMALWAQNWIESRSIDLVLLDGRLRDSNSRNLFDWIRRAYSRIPIVILGDLGDGPLFQEYLGAGALGCLAKPIALTQLEDLIQQASDIQNLRWATPFDQAVNAIVATLGIRDVETEEHCHRVACYSVLLARAMGINDDRRLKLLEWGASLHDVGKIGIPDSILHKPSALNDEEWALMKQHPEIGRRLLSRVPFLEEVLPMVYHHHERYDGSGYPERLKGSSIPLEARIFAIADTVDAMRSDRPYRKGSPLPTILDLLSREKGRQFDPEIVDVAVANSAMIFENQYAVPSLSTEYGTSAWRGI